MMFSDNISIKTKDEIHLMAKSGAIAGFVLREIIKSVKPGITTFELDQKAKRLIEARGAKPAFLGFEGYEYSICCSINDEIVHGIPSKRKIKSGDLVKIDLGANLDGFYSDCAATVAVSSVNSDQLRLIDGTRSALENVIKIISPGKRIGDLEYEIGKTLREFGLSPVLKLTGHGIGRSLHEPPQIRCDGKKSTGELLEEGMTLAIEPMATLGSGDVKILKSGDWVVKSSDKTLGAHFEHTVLVTKNGGRILTTPK